MRESLLYNFFKVWEMFYNISCYTDRVFAHQYWLSTGFWRQPLNQKTPCSDMIHSFWVSVLKNVHFFRSGIKRVSFFLWCRWIPILFFMPLFPSESTASQGGKWTAGIRRCPGLQPACGWSPRYLGASALPKWLLLLCCHVVLLQNLGPLAYKHTSGSMLNCGLLRTYFLLLVLSNAKDLCWLPTGIQFTFRHSD